MMQAGDGNGAFSEDDFEALEALLVSEAVPADCMNLEMLDGYLAAIVAAPVPIAPERWMPAVWSAQEEDVSFGSGGQMQLAIAMVLRYHNQLVATMGAEAGWQPFCYAPDDSDEDAPLLAEEWAGGFEQGLECWPEDWDAGLPEAAAEAVRQRLEAVLEPWLEEGAEDADEDVRFGWLEEAADAVRELVAGWPALGRSGAAPVAVQMASAPKGGPGRNEPCPCGSGKKYKQCCGALT